MDLFEIPDDYKPQKPLTDHQVDQITNYLKGHPLFLKQLPQDIESNQHLAALQALNEDQDPQKRAFNLNKQANGRLKQGPNSPYYMRDAYQKYTEAINLKPKDTALLAKLHCNRASINLKYKNFGKVIEDCKESIKLDQKYIKAYYRMGKAFISLKKYKQCIELLSNQTDPDLKKVLDQAKQLKKKEEQSKQKKQQKQNKSSNKIEAYFAKKKWMLKKRHEQLPQGVQIEFIDQKISIPIVIVYPQFGQFDLIAHSGQYEKISTCLSVLFQSPLPWDAKKEYRPETIELFAQIQEGFLLKIPKQANIGEIAQRVPIKGALQITILANNEFAGFYKNQYKIS